MNQIIVHDKSSDLIYDSISKEYKDLYLLPNAIIKKKIKYMNPDDYNKQLTFIPSDSIIKLAKQEMKLDLKSSDYIRFSFETPSTQGVYKPFIKIFNATTGDVE